MRVEAECGCGAAFRSQSSTPDTFAEGRVMDLFRTWNKAHETCSAVKATTDASLRGDHSSALETGRVPVSEPVAQPESSEASTNTSPSQVNASGEK